MESEGLTLMLILGNAQHVLLASFCFVPCQDSGRWPDGTSASEHLACNCVWQWSLSHATHVLPKHNVW